MNIESEPQNMDKAKAVNEINGILAEVAAMGNNNGELEQIRSILKELESGEVSPEDAVQAAEMIRDSKHQI